MDEKIVARVLALLDRCATALEAMAAAQKRYADVDCPQQAPLGPVGPPRGDAWEPPALRAKPEASKGRGEDKPHAPALDGLPEAQRVVAETARALAEAEKKADLVDWAPQAVSTLPAVGPSSPSAMKATLAADDPSLYSAEKVAARVAARIAECPHGSPTLHAALHCPACRDPKAFAVTVCRSDDKPGATSHAPVTPASWAAPPTSLDALRARLFALLRAKLGLAGEGASLEARKRCVVESTAKATAEDLRRGIESLAGLPDFVAPALPAGPISSYTAEAGRARGCSVALAAKLAELEPENKAPSLAELTTIHAPPVLAAAKAKAGIPAGSRARDVAEARLVVMALPVVAPKEVSP